MAKKQAFEGELPGWAAAVIAMHQSGISPELMGQYSKHIARLLQATTQAMEATHVGGSLVEVEDDYEDDEAIGFK